MLLGGTVQEHVFGVEEHVVSGDQVEDLLDITDRNGVVSGVPLVQKDCLESIN